MSDKDITSGWSDTNENTSFDEALGIKTPKPDTSTGSGWDNEKGDTDPKSGW